jgi:Protein of unknown function (DUF1186)
MKKELILEKISLPGRQLNIEILQEIQKNPMLYKKDLLKILKKESVKPQSPSARIEYNHWLYAMYLLAEQRDKDALAPILKLFSRKGNFLNPLTGDIVLQNLGQILASVANGDIASIIKLTENTKANEYCRAAGIESLVILTEIGDYNREDLYHYFDGLFKNLERESTFVWSMLAQSAIVLFKKSFFKEVKQAFHNQLIDEIFLDLEEVEAYIDNPELSQLALVKKKYGIIIDAIAAMDWWANFKENKEEI